MILYQLRCSNDHQFEAWFRNSSAYDIQINAGDVVCPHCSDTVVSKAIMAPNISPARSNSKPKIEHKKTEIQAKEVAEQVLKSIDMLRSYVEANCDDVGNNFAEEARRIHYGETKKRGIFGQATDEETTELDDEGVEFYRLPSRIRRNN